MRPETDGKQRPRLSGRLEEMCCLDARIIPCARRGIDQRMLLRFSLEKSQAGIHVLNDFEEAFCHQLYRHIASGNRWRKEFTLQDSKPEE